VPAATLRICCRSSGIDVDLLSLSAARMCDRRDSPGGHPVRRVSPTELAGTLKPARHHARNRRDVARVWLFSGEVAGTVTWRPERHLLPVCPGPGPAQAGCGRRDVKVSR